jgi:hypothetical protein
MKFLAGTLIAVLLLGSVGAGHAAVRIGNDRGGRIGDYIDKYRHLRDTGEFVIIDGLCAGACTIVLAAISRDKICLTSNARFGFKAAWDLGADGHQVVNHGATKTLYSVYPVEVQRWIAQRGGLTAHMIFLQGRPLHRLYRSCSPDA